jgi:3-oxoacyl-[acyl-carrier protein] reductase
MKLAQIGEQSMPAKLLTDKVALVTGASRGIGRCIALALAENGARVALTARTKAELLAVQSEIEASGSQAASFPSDISQETQAIALVQNTVEHFGRLDILINNAGSVLAKPLIETSTKEWDNLMAINARAPFILCRQAIPYLKQQELSFIINIASVVGVKGYVNQSIYSASKHALLGMTKALAKEVQADGIRVHAINPGGVDTDLVGLARPDLDRSVLMQPEEIAEIVLFLVTRQGRAVIDEINVRRAASTPWA